MDYGFDDVLKGLHTGGFKHRRRKEDISFKEAARKILERDNITQLKYLDIEHNREGI